MRKIEEKLELECYRSKSVPNAYLFVFRDEYGYFRAFHFLNTELYLRKRLTEKYFNLMINAGFGTDIGRFLNRVTIATSHGWKLMFKL